jgi:predicted RNA-binding Zn-ribbon protein involved in translation (DUF1610 family)
MKEHRLTHTVHTHVTCGKCKHKWKVSGRLVTYTCPKCNHQNIAMNSL